MKNKEFTQENLVQFELDYFSVPSKFPSQRYGQAIINTFGNVFYKKDKDRDFFYSENTDICRSVVWLSLPYHRKNL